MPQELQYQFGNGPVMEVKHLRWDSLQREVAEPQSVPVDLSVGRYGTGDIALPGSPEWEEAYSDKLAEIRDNWRIASDLESRGGRTLEVTLVNSHAVGNDNGSMLRLSKNSVADDMVEAVELAQDAAANPDMAIIHVVIPGHGGSSGLSAPELIKARRDGRLVGTNLGFEDGDKDIEEYDPFPSIKSMAEIIRFAKGGTSRLTHISASDEAAHFAGALMPLLPDVERAVLTNPTNVSERYRRILELFGLGDNLHYINMSRPREAAEMAGAVKYDLLSDDPLSITTDRIEEARRLMGPEFFEHADAERADLAHHGGKRGEKRIYMKGMARGAAAVHHIVAGLRQNPEAKVTYIFPERSSNYKGRYELVQFIEAIFETYGQDSEEGRRLDVQGVLLPVGQHWHRYHPLARLALQDEAFTR